MSSKYGPRAPVPKFSSFAPKKDEVAETNEIEPGSRSSRRHEDSKKDRNHRSHHSHGHSRHGVERSERHRSPKAERDSPLDREAPPAVLDNIDNQVFFIDKRGDRLISQYGSNDRRRVPNYRRSWRGRVLGSDGFFVVEREGEKEFFTIQSSRQGDSSFQDRRSILSKAVRWRGKPVRLKKGDVTIPDLTATDDFVPLKSKPKAAEDRSTIEKDDDDDQPIYRSIEGKAKEHEFSDSDLDYGSDSSAPSEDSPELSRAKARALELSSRVKDHPEDINAWIELIQLQGAEMRQKLGNGESVSTAEAKSYADIKVSMYDKALAHARSAVDRGRLQLGLMKEGTKIWDGKTLQKRWEGMSREDLTSQRLWKLRLDHEITDLSTFNYDSLRKLYVERLNFLQARIREELPVSLDGATKLADQLLYVFLRLTCFMRWAGYTELAVAAWQSLLELTFSRPDTSSQLVERFSDFWESEVPRVGEDNANGFKYFVASGGTDEAPEPKAAPNWTLPETANPYKTWASREQARAAGALMPARTLDDGTEDDPFRAVLFSDIEEFLVVIPGLVVDRVKPQLIDAFLLYCRLPPAFGTNDVIQLARVDPFVSGGSKEFEKDVTTLRTPSTDSDAQDSIYGHFQQDGHQMVASPELLFAGPEWFKYVMGLNQLYGPLERPVDLSWVQNTLVQLTGPLGFEQLAEYRLAYEWASAPEAGKKVAKGLLKQYSSNIGLYDAYARMELANGNPDVARKVLSSAVGLAKEGSASRQVLFNTWTWLEFESGDKAKAVGRLCASVEASPNYAADTAETTTTPAQILKARQSFASSRDYLLSQGHVDAAATFAESLALLEYFCSRADPANGEPQSSLQGCITASLASVASFSADLSSRGPALARSAPHERLLQTAARLLHAHCRRGPHRRAFVAAQLQRAFLAFFPRNTLLLEMLAWAGPPSPAAGLLADPVRQFLRRQWRDDDDADESGAGDDADLAVAVFAIRHERSRGVVAGMHAVRAAFERALAPPSGAGCGASAWLWRCYVRFCAAAHFHEDGERRKREGARKGGRSKGEKRTAGARLEGGEKGEKSRAASKEVKEVFYRAIRACPGNRDLLMEAFGVGTAAAEQNGETVADAMGMDDHELRAVYETMVRQGLRVNAELDEFLAEWEARRKVEEEEEKKKKMEAEKRKTPEREEGADCEWGAGRDRRQETGRRRGEDRRRDDRETAGDRERTYPSRDRGRENTRDRERNRDPKLDQKWERHGDGYYRR